MSGLHWCEGERGAENLLCVHWHEQAAGDGAELRPGDHRQQTLRSEFTGSSVPQSAEKEDRADVVWAVISDVAAHLRKRCIAIWRISTLSHVGQLCSMERWSLCTITTLFYSQTKLHLVVSPFSFWLSLKCEGVTALYYCQIWIWNIWTSLWSFKHKNNGIFYGPLLEAYLVDRFGIDRPTALLLGY